MPVALALLEDSMQHVEPMLRTEPDVHEAGSCDLGSRDQASRVAEHLDQTSITVEHRAMGNIDIGSEDVYHNGWKDLLDIRLRAVIGG